MAGIDTSAGSGQEPELHHPKGLTRALAKQTFHIVVTYQPAGRYWAFQWLETGIYLLLALLAAVACYWWVVRRSD